MGNAGSDYALFRRALLTKSLPQIEMAAKQLPQVSLEDALKILLVLAEKKDERYGRAAARWAARATAELGLSVDDSRRVLALVEVLPEAPDAVCMTLKGILTQG